MKPFLILLFVGMSAVAGAQSQDTGYVNVHADPRLAVVVNKPAAANKAFIGKRNGFRVQIYNGSDRKKASQVKLEFMKHFPATRSYIVYNNPQFRVRVGDFVSRSEAAELLNKLSSQFSPCMIVPDVVNVNSTKSHRDKTKANDNSQNE